MLANIRFICTSFRNTVGRKASLWWGFLSVSRRVLISWQSMNIVFILQCHVQSNLDVSNLVDLKSRMCRGNFPVPANFPLVLCIFTSDDSNSDDSKSWITRVCLEVPRKGKQCNFTSMCRSSKWFFSREFRTYNIFLNVSK